jgi:adenine C2-methylase RlmN of 23S rRNA A2503 and tRNA A37
MNTTRANGWPITNLWKEENLTDYYREMMKNGSAIEYVLIDDVMRDKGVNTKLYEIIEMTNESYEKFSRHPFELVYRNASLNKEGEELHWAEVYAINWTYIEWNLENGSRIIKPS